MLCLTPQGTATSPAIRPIGLTTTLGAVVMSTQSMITQSSIMTTATVLSTSP
jgi:hypothetical protein